MAFGGQGFGAFQYPGGGARQTVQGGYVQVPQSQGSGSPFSSLLGLAGLATSLIPGAQAVSPYLTAGAQVASGDYAGAAKSATTASGAGENTQATTEGAEGTPPPQVDDSGNDQNPLELYTDKKAEERAEDDASINPASSPLEQQEYYRQLFMQNPWLMMQSMYQTHPAAIPQFLNNSPGGILPNVGFNQFAS